MSKDMDAAALQENKEQAQDPQKKSKPKAAAGQYLKPGTLVQNRYEVIRPIKSGGMGAVYEVLDKRLQKNWALKEMIESFSNEQERIEATERFQREATLLASLDHPNLPRVIDYFEDLGRFYLVMDFVIGSDLNELVKKFPQNRLPEERVKQIAGDILSILDYLHNQPEPIIYRDIKPANIMIRTADNSTILIDFGIARSLSNDSGAPKTEIGTVGYAPPEQYMGNPLPVSDLYALAATMHELLSGKHPRVPFQFQPLREILPDLSNDINDVITKALELNHRDRWKNAAEMLEALTADDTKKKEAPPADSFNELPGLGSFSMPGSLDSFSNLGSGGNISFTLDQPIVTGEPPLLTQKSYSPMVPQIEPEPDPVRETLRPDDISFARLTPEEKMIMDNLYLYSHKFREISAVFDNLSSITDIKFHPERELLAYTDKKGEVHLKDITSLNKIWSMNTAFPGLLTLAFSDSGKHMAFNSKTFECLVVDTKGHIEISRLNEQFGSISKILFIPMEMSVIIAYKNGKLVVYDYAIQKHSLINYDESPISNLAISSNGVNFISAHENGTLRLWHTQSRMIVASAKEHRANITALEIAPNDKVLASGGADGNIILWNMRSLQVVKVLSCGDMGAVNSLAYTADKPYICSSSEDGTIRIWDLPSKMNTVIHKNTESPFTKIAMGTYGHSIHFVATAGNNLYLWKHI